MPLCGNLAEALKFPRLQLVNWTLSTQLRRRAWLKQPGGHARAKLAPYQHVAVRPGLLLGASGTRHCSPEDTRDPEEPHIHVALVPWTRGLPSEEQPRLSGFCLVSRVR